MKTTASPPAARTVPPDGTFCLNLISSPGSGKTSLLERTLASSRARRVAVLTGDLQTDNDARRLARYGFPVRQITTGGSCHLDARMVERGGRLEPGRSRDPVHRERRQPGLPHQLRPGRGGARGAAQRDRRRGQAAEIPRHFPPRRPDGAQQDRPAALRPLQCRVGARECAPRAAGNRDRGCLLHFGSGARAVERHWIQRHL